MPEPEPYVYQSDQDRAFGEKFFQENGLKKNNTLILHPGASTFSKAWMPERYAEIGKLFSDTFKGRVLVTWGPGEENLAGTVVDSIGNNAVKGQKTMVGQLASLLSMSGLCVCNYSGVMNVAMAVKTPMVALGCTSAADWGPYGAIHRTVNSAGEKDSYTDQERVEAMRRITVEEVRAVISQRWNELMKESGKAAAKS